MKFLNAMLPNLTISLNLVIMIVLYVNSRNPMMGFLTGAPFLVLSISTCICSIATAVILYAKWRNGNSRR